MWDFSPARENVIRSNFLIHFVSSFFVNYTVCKQLRSCLEQKYIIPLRMILHYFEILLLTAKEAVVPVDR